MKAVMGYDRFARNLFLEFP